MREFIYIKYKSGYRQVLFSEVLYLEAEDKYTSIVTVNYKLQTLFALSSMEQMLPTDIFCGIHRSYIVSLFHTKYFNSSVAVIGKKNIPIGRQFKSILHGRVITLANESLQNVKLSAYDLAKLFKMKGSN